MRVTDFPLPDAAAVRAALEVATAYCTDAIVNHSIRSWLWAAGLAALEGRAEYDAELVAVSALLHDVGLVTEFDNHTISYEHSGGHVAWVLTAGAGWDAARRDRALEVIVRHNWDAVDPAEDVEGYLLEAATGLDIAGARLDELPAEFVREVVERYPRLDLAQEFGAALQEQAARKPETSARRLVDEGLLAHLAANPLESGAKA